MNIIQVHCAYLHRGGEDAVAAAELKLLRARGHQIYAFHASNRDAIDGGAIPTLRALHASAWNRGVYRRLRETIRSVKPDIVHVHNFWFSLSPSVFGAARDEGVPVVMTLHNYRLLCTNGLLLRDGVVCEKCIGRSVWPSVPLACYRDSRLQTALVARMIQANRRRKTWDRSVDGYIALTQFACDKFIQGGIPPEKIHVKSNVLLEDPGPADRAGTGAVFVGRISREKGVRVLLDAWKHFPETALDVVGGGPELELLKEHARETPHVRFHGQQSRASVIENIKNAAFLVMPSVLYETFGLAIVESFACGRPVIASRLGAMAELVTEGKTGLLFEPGNAEDLATKVKAMLDNPRECARMGREARAEFEKKFTIQMNYSRLIEIYQRIIDEA